MKTRVNLCAGVFAMAITAGGCGPNLTAVPPGPTTGPTTLAPLLLPKLDGVWGGQMTFLGVAGGTGPAVNAGAQACAGAAFNAVFAESNDYSLSIKQTGSDLSARLTSAGTGLACTYSGRVGSNTVMLDAASCDAATLVFRCPSGDDVDLELVGSSITAAIDAPVSVTSISGVAAHTYNIRTSVEVTGNHDQGMVARHSFTALARR
jgi:hypothetical protein